MQEAPIELYYWPTPNGWKITVMLEELLDSILTAVLDFSADHHFDDDVCLLAVEFSKS